MKSHYLLFIFLTCAGLLVLAGCSGGSSTSSSPSPTPLSAEQILAESSSKLEAAGSFHFELDHEGGGSPIAMGIAMLKASGDMVKPDKMKTTISGIALGMAIQVEVITVSHETYMTNPLNGRWELLPNEFQVLSVFDPATGVAAIMKNMSGATRLADEEAAGKTCYHISGEIDSGNLNSITGSSIQGIMNRAEIWIAMDDFLPQVIKLEGRITEEEKEGITRTLSFSDYNLETKIEKPVLD
ncbi:MAG: LppX_LprAFG lipoprotein [Dehalococcoidales bacterium]|nr:LppX_LprAFG lipoprotein [Dehalococcoidales bacterium]